MNIKKTIFLIVIYLFIHARLVAQTNKKFTIGLYGVSYRFFDSPVTLNDIPVVRGDSVLGYKSGINVIQDYQVFDYNFPKLYKARDMQIYLNEAEKYGFKVMLTFKRTAFSVNHAHYYTDPDKWHYYDELISDFKQDTAALYGYYVADEPTAIANNDQFLRAITPDTLKKAINRFKKIDPNGTYIMAIPDYNDYDHNESNWAWNDSGVIYSSTSHGRTFSTPADYDNTGLNIIINDTYQALVRTTWLSNWNKSLKQYDDLVGNIMHPRDAHAALNIEFNKNPDNNLSDFRKKLRYKAFSAIVHGVQGIWFFSYGDSWNVEDRLKYSYRSAHPSEIFKQVVVPISVELSDLSNFLNGKTISQYLNIRHHVGFAPDLADTSLEYLIKKSNNSNELLLIIINSSTERKSINLSLTSQPLNDTTRVIYNANKAAVLFENLSGDYQPLWYTSVLANVPQHIIKITDSRLIDHIDGLGVKIYLFSSTK